MPKRQPLQPLGADLGANGFGAIRMALALLVVFSHSFVIGTGTEDWEPIARLTRGQATAGSIAVDLFFVISGFLVAASAERSRTLWSFLEKRIARIYPGFVVAMLFGLAVARTVATATGRAGVADFVRRTLLLQEFTYGGAFAANPYPDAINESAWTLPYEFWCYLGLAVLAMAGWLRRPRLLLALFGAAMVLRVLFAVYGWDPGGGPLEALFGWPWPRRWARFLPVYLVGVLAYLYRLRIPVSRRLAAVSLGAVVVAALVPHGWSALWPVAGGYLVLFAAHQPWITLRGFGRDGDLSYGTYLYGFPVQQSIVSLVGHPLAPLALFALAAPVALCLAAVSWYAVERPFLARARRAQAGAPGIEKNDSESQAAHQQVSLGSPAPVGPGSPRPTHSEDR